VAWFEVDSLFSRDGDALTGLGIAADTGVACADPEAAEAAELYFVALLQGGGETVQDGLNGLEGFGPVELRLLGDTVGKIRFGHGVSFFARWLVCGDILPGIRAGGKGESSVLNQPLLSHDPDPSVSQNRNGQFSKRLHQLTKHFNRTIFLLRHSRN